jgi:hypothetical protein
MNRTVAKRSAAGAVSAPMSTRSRHALRSLHRTRGSSAMVQGLLHAVGLSRRQLQAAYPFVAALLQALPASPPKFGRRRANHLSSQAARA